jgi:hypothetical protein
MSARILLLIKQLSMNITIFGASGQTGSLLLEQALKQGHHVTAYVRKASRVKMRHQNLQVIEGNLNNMELLCKSLKGRQAVISALGVSKTLHSDPEVVQGIRNIVMAMARENVTRLIYMSVFLADSKPGEFSFFARRILKYIIRKEVEDHELKERIVRECVNDYTLVRPVRLHNKAFPGKFHHGETITSDAILPSISRADVSSFIIQQLTDRTYNRKAVRIMMEADRKN